MYFSITRVSIITVNVQQSFHVSLFSSFFNFSHLPQNLPALFNLIPYSIPYSEYMTLSSTVRIYIHTCTQEESRYGNFPFPTLLSPDLILTHP